MTAILDLSASIAACLSFSWRISVRPSLARHSGIHSITTSDKLAPLRLILVKFGRCTWRRVLTFLMYCSALQ